MADRQLLLPEVVVPEMRLGRNINHDPRSLAYKVTPRRTPKTTHWERRIPVQDQGDLGRCVPTSAVGCLGTEPFYSNLPPEIRKLVNDKTAVELYREVTRADPFPGEWEPTDTGSDGLSMAKVLQKRQWINGYLHITSLDAALDAILDGPFITGVMWMSGMDVPTREGIVSVSGSVRGGHEFVIDGADVERELIECTNSWTEGWGARGRFKIPFADYSKLLGMQGDGTVFVPLTAPTPIPTPVPEPTDLLKTFPYASMDAWAKAKKLWWTKRDKSAAEAYLDWRQKVK